MRTQRLLRLQSVVKRRQPDLTVILENVHDMHNIGAVMRTCDSVGVYRVFVLQSDPELRFSNLHLGKKTSAGTRKWVDVHYYTDRDTCFDRIEALGMELWATHLDEQAVSLFEMDLSRPVALLFGNEHDGIPRPSLERCKGNFIIPQMGMVQSLNISVACAVTLYEACRQRKASGMYELDAELSGEKQLLLEQYHRRHEQKYDIKHILPEDAPGLSE